MKRITLDGIMALHPCADYPRDRVAQLMAGRESVTARDVLGASIPAEDKLWLVLREEILDARTLRELACDFAQAALDAYGGDEKSQQAIDLALGAAAGVVDASTLEAAWAAAGEAAWAAEAAAREAARAAGAARAAAGAAAWEAAREAARAAWAAAGAAAWGARAAGAAAGAAGAAAGAAGAAAGAAAWGAGAAEEAAWGARAAEEAARAAARAAQVTHVLAVFRRAGQ